MKHFIPVALKEKDMKEKYKLGIWSKKGFFSTLLNSCGKECVQMLKGCEQQKSKAFF